jgi:hypothetical protein
MAIRLPDAPSVFQGERPSLRSQRRIASFDTTAIPEGERAAALGQVREAQAIGEGSRIEAEGDARLGKSLEGLGTSVSNLYDKENKLDTARAKANFYSGVARLDQKRDDNQDPDDLQEKHKPLYRQNLEESASLIPDKRERELFKLQHDPDVTRREVSVDSRAFTLRRDDKMATSLAELDTYRESALTATDPETRSKTIQSAGAVIDRLEEAGYIDATKAQKARKLWMEGYAEEAVKLLSPRERIAALHGGWEGALVAKESGARAHIVNKQGYAGIYQFGAPRLATLGLYQKGAGESFDNDKWSGAKWSGSLNVPGHPDVKTLDDFLKSPDAQKTAFNLHVQKMDAEIAQNGFAKYEGKTVGGVPITRQGLYSMMHLGGVGGAKAFLESGGRVNRADANGTTVGDYAALGLAGGRNTDVAKLLPLEKREQLLDKATKELTAEEHQIAANTAKQAMQRGEEWERQILDAGAGKATLPARSEIENDAGLDLQRKNTVLRQYDLANARIEKSTVDLKSFNQAVSTNGFAWNPFDKEHQGWVEAGFEARGGTVEALQSVFKDTGIVPKSAGTALRGALSSNDPTRIQGALTIASNLIANNPNALAAVEGRGDIEDAAVDFRRQVDHFNMPAADAVKRYISQQTPEYKANKAARIKAEDIDNPNSPTMKKVSVEDLRSAFDNVPWIPGTDPQIGFDPKSRGLMYSDYVEKFREHFLEAGDVDNAKARAIKDVKQVWGVTYLGGTVGGNVMRYPPEKAPAFRGIENVSEKIAAQAIADIKAKTGQDVARGGLRLSPIEGITAPAYKGGQEQVPYLISWNDKNGNPQISPFPWYADVRAMHAAQFEQRRVATEKSAAVAGQRMDQIERNIDAQRRLLTGLPMNAEERAGLREMELEDLAGARDGGPRSAPAYQPRARVRSPRAFERELPEEDR